MGSVPKQTTATITTINHKTAIQARCRAIFIRQWHSLLSVICMFCLQLNSAQQSVS